MTSAQAVVKGEGVLEGKYNIEDILPYFHLIADKTEGVKLTQFSKMSLMVDPQQCLLLCFLAREHL